MPDSATLASADPIDRLDDDDDDELDSPEDDDDDEDDGSSLVQDSTRARLDVGAVLWRSLRHQPERRGELAALLDGPTIAPLVVSLVLLPGRTAPVVGAVDGGPPPATSVGASKTRPTGRPDPTSARLCVVDERTGLLILEIGQESYAVPMRQRVVLPISSDVVRVLPNTQARIVTGRQGIALLLDRLVIGGTPSDWVVNDVTLRRQSQFSGDLPGDVFAATAMTGMRFGVLAPGDDVSMTVTYVGGAAGGCRVHGRDHLRVSGSLGRPPCEVPRGALDPGGSETGLDVRADRR